MTQPNPFPSSGSSINPNPMQPNQDIIVAAQLTKRVKSGAAMFYYVAGLSVVNTLMAVFNAGRYFVVGLAISLFVDGIFIGIAEALPESQTMLKVIDILASILIAGVYVFFGYMASRGKRWAFIVGMVLYALDALLMLAFQEWLGLLFHLFFLWGMFSGFRALNQLQKYTVHKTQTSDFPQNIGAS
jgi:hypothetical protein